MRLIGCPEMSVRNSHYTLCDIPEERRSHVGNNFEQEIYGVVYFQSAIEIVSLNAFSLMELCWGRLGTNF
jgi:hypothetical protein